MTEAPSSNGSAPTVALVHGAFARQRGLERRGRRTVRAGMKVQATEAESAIDPEMVHDASAADVSSEQARVMAATRRPVSSLGVTG